MWRFLEGVSQPPAKKKKSETQIAAVAHVRNRTFLPSRQKGRPWLVFMHEVIESQSISQTTTSGGKMSR